MNEKLFIFINVIISVILAMIFDDGHWAIRSLAGIGVYLGLYKLVDKLNIRLF